VAGVEEFVLGERPHWFTASWRDFRDAGIVGEEVVEALLVVLVVLPDAGAGGVVAVGIVVVLADVVGGEAARLLKSALPLGMMAQRLTSLKLSGRPR
jgi:hypothetical protein